MLLMNRALVEGTCGELSEGPGEGNGSWIIQSTVAAKPSRSASTEVGDPGLDIWSRSDRPKPQYKVRAKAAVGR